MSKKLLFVVNIPNFFLSHRLPIAEAALNEGFDVHVATMGGNGVEKIEQLGFTHHFIPLSRSGRNPLKELIALYAIWSLFRKLHPDLVHLVTIKPVLYGGIAARILNLGGVVSAISGLGFIFIERPRIQTRLLRYVVLLFYRFAMGHPNQKVIFQNSADISTLVRSSVVSKDKTIIIRGSGVDFRDYSVLPEPDGVPVVMMASRLLKDKGVLEFVEAARLLQSLNVKAHFKLVGDTDYGNPESVTAELVQAWQKEGIIEYMGFRSDIPKLFSQANIITLPSYREGLPKVLIEAASCGRAVVTTDTPGCRDAIEPNLSGLLVPVRDANALAQAINRLLDNVELRHAMGKEGRALAEREFGIEKVIIAHMAIYHELLGIGSY